MAPLWSGLAGYVLGVALQLQQERLWVQVHYGLLLGAALVLGAVAFRRILRSAYMRLALWVVSGALMAFGATGLRAVHHMDRSLSSELEGVDIVVSGVIATLPRRSIDSDRFELEVDTAILRGTAVQLPPRILLSDFRGAAPGRDWRAGEAWRLVVRLRSPHGLSNPHGFDRERWLLEQGIGATGYVRDGPRDPPPVRLGKRGVYPVEAARQWISEHIAARLDDPRAAGVLVALVVGDQGAIDRADWALFRTTGIAHLMSISGVHVTAFAWLATALIGRGWRRVGALFPSTLLALPAPLAAAWGGLLMAFAYAVFSGWGVPAQRTVLMLAVVVWLRMGVRQWPWPCVWLIAMVAVLALDPWALSQAGFWLSFVAVAVLFSSGQRSGRGEHAPSLALHWRQRVGRSFGGLLREQAAVTLALSPLTLVLFGQMSVVGMVANLVAIPWVTLVVVPLAMAGVLLSPLWDVAALAVQGLSAFVASLGAWRWASLTLAIVPGPLAALGIFGGFLLIQRWPWNLRVVGLLMLIPMVVWSPPRPAPGAFEVMAADVGQGGAVLVRTATRSLLYDTGPSFGASGDAGERVVVPLLRALGETPDTVVVSHRDGDHAGGSAAVRAAWPQARWMTSYGEGEPCVAGQRWVWDGVSFEVLHPSPSHYGPGGEGRLSSNAMSCVLRIDNGRRSVWLSGDLDSDQETRLALDRPDLRADLLLAPHHGSASSSSPVLLNTLRPSMVLIQSGYRNRFGHPAAAVLDRYRERQIPWVASPQCGAAIWRSDHPESVWCHREEHRRYWHHPGANPPGRSDDAPSDP